jgi:hypothetical protein
VARVEVDHLNPSGAEVKKEWSYTSTPHNASMARTKRQYYLLCFIFKMRHEAFACSQLCLNHTAYYTVTLIFYACFTWFAVC